MNKKDECVPKLKLGKRGKCRCVTCEDGWRMAKLIANGPKRFPGLKPSWIPLCSKDDDD